MFPLRLCLVLLALCHTASSTSNLRARGGATLAASPDDWRQELKAMQAKMLGAENVIDDHPAQTPEEIALAQSNAVVNVLLGMLSKDVYTTKQTIKTIDEGAERRATSIARARDAKTGSEELKQARITVALKHDEIDQTQKTLLQAKVDAIKAINLVPGSAPSAAVTEALKAAIKFRREAMEAIEGKGNTPTKEQLENRLIAQGPTTSALRNALDAAGWQPEATFKAVFNNPAANNAGYTKKTAAEIAAIKGVPGELVTIQKQFVEKEAEELETLKAELAAAQAIVDADTQQKKQAAKNAAPAEGAAAWQSKATKIGANGAQNIQRTKKKNQMYQKTIANKVAEDKANGTSGNPLMAGIIAQRKKVLGIGATASTTPSGRDNDGTPVQEGEELTEGTIVKIRENKLGKVLVGKLAKVTGMSGADGSRRVKLKVKLDDDSTMKVMVRPEQLNRMSS